ncbi:MAG: hypothetical protein IT581_19600 [Verrucomicrobiales bacterium]|nr:hypothetical protein [Verrucomicrobiales bacterium]
MKRLALGLGLGVILGGLSVWWASRPAHQGSGDRPDALSGQEAGNPSNPTNKNEPGDEGDTRSFVHRDKNGTVLLNIDRETQGLLGLTSAPVTAVQWKPQVEAFGQVLDPGPLLALLTDAAAARLSLESSTREFDRLRILAGNQNASARALETAETALKRDQLAVAAVAPRLANSWGPAIAANPDPGALADALGRQQFALIRVDVAFADLSHGEPLEARVAPLTDSAHPEPADILGPAAAANPQWQGRGLLLLQRIRPLSPGTAVKAWLTLPGESESGIEVPREAVLRHEGALIAYHQIDDVSFVRVPIHSDRRTAAGWWVSSGLSAGDRLVTVGAQILLSEELKGRGGEED